MNKTINLMDDGTLRTIKANYQQVSTANFMYTSTYGASGVINIEVEDDRRNGQFGRNDGKCEQGIRSERNISNDTDNMWRWASTEIFGNEVDTENRQIRLLEQSRAEQSRAEQSRAA